MNDKYSIALMWSDEDEAYIARVNELPGCFADGETAEEAIRAVHLVIGDWIEEARRLGRDVPAPLTTQVVDQTVGPGRR
jgi:predicted RNase H-like HicB family nuclease